MKIRDPVHNFLDLPDEFAPLVNSAVLQRLRGVRQLALASLVYPGALHTRFDHSLGVTHVAGMMSEVLRLEAEERRLVQLAALLHDIGHGPFSHVSEASLRRYADILSLKKNQNPNKIHELVTTQIIESNRELSRLVSEDDRDHVVQLLGEGYGRRVLRQIVSGPLDADKQDYLLRDSRFSGVEYGIFDLHQLHRSLILFGVEGDQEILIAQDGVHPAEQFMLAKYYMTANVYRHRVRLITDQMIGRAIQLGIENDQLEQMQGLYCFDNTVAFVDNYLLWDDIRFMETFCPLHEKPPGELSGALLVRLRKRQLLKEVYQERIEALDARFREYVVDISKPQHTELRRDIERAVADYLSTQLQCDCPSDFVIVHSYSIKSVRESSRNDENEILVLKGNRPCSFTDESKLLGSINEAYSDDLVAVYAPVTWPDSSNKDSLRREWEQAIRDLIVQQCEKYRRNSRSESS